MVSGPQIKRRETWIELPDEYEGFKARIWVNAPAFLWSKMQSKNEKEVLEAVQQVVLEHNGWLDFDGQPYPPAETKEFWDAIPTELAAVILSATQLEMQKLPNSLGPKKRP